MSADHKRKEPKVIDLEPGEFREAEAKYPRKLPFGLVDYGPPPITWQMVVGIIITVAIVTFARYLPYLWP
jgi:hypothetical protein